MHIRAHPTLEPRPVLRSFVNTAGERSVLGEITFSLCEITFSAHIDNQTVPIFRGGSYEIVFVGTFKEGNTSISYAVFCLKKKKVTAKIHCVDIFMMSLWCYELQGSQTQHWRALG